MKKYANEPQQVSTKETEILLSLAGNVLKVPGDFVEFGCYRGDTSVKLQKLLQTTKTAKTTEDAETAKTTEDAETAIAAENSKNTSTPEKRLFIYDSFAGLPEKSLNDASVAGDAFKKGELFVTKREVIEKFKKSGLRLPVIKKAFFENLDPKSDLPEKIAFAFLDGDLYSSIKTSLKLTAPRMVKNGIIVVHDYNNPELPGSAKAVDEFLSTHSSLRLEVRETLAIIRNDLHLMKF